MSELSVIIPALNEQFLARTVEDVLANARADTEVIAVCDGYWPDPPLEDRERLTVLHFSQPVGQRAATNAGVRVSEAKYVMKLDAHCAVNEGFDAKLMEGCRPDWTMVPSMHNLHAYDWECVNCGKRTYQGSEPKKCEDCGGNVSRMLMVWKPRHKRPTVSWRFDRSMQFQYWRSHHKRPEWRDKPLVETMSFIGACFMMRRDRFWELGGLDEAHGSWGQFGTEVACKSWLSGGKVVTSRKTWFAHMFRTGNFARYGECTWPYPISGEQIERARRYSRDLWLNDRWPGAKRPLAWLVERFKPVPDWHREAE